MLASASKPLRPWEPRALPLLLAIVVAVGALAVHLRYAWPGGAHTRSSEPWSLVRDEGTVLYDAYRWTRGEVMYRDFFEFQTPLFYATHGLLFAVTGPSLPAARVLAAVVAALSALLLADVVSRRAGPAAGVAAASLHVFLIVPTWPVAYPHWHAELYALAAVWLIVARDEAESPRRQALRQMALGVCAALSFLSIQSLGIPLLAALVLGETSRGLSRDGLREGARSALRVVAGAAIPIVPVALGFAAFGALDELVRDTWTWPLTHYATGNRDASSYASHLDQLVEANASLPVGLGRVMTVLLYATAALPLAAVTLGALSTAWMLVRLLARRVPSTDALAWLACAGAVASLFSGKVRPDVTHVAYVASFGLVALAAAAGASMSLAVRRAFGAILVIGAVAALTTFGAKTWLLRNAALASTFDEELRRVAEPYTSIDHIARRVIEHSTTGDEPIVVGSLEGYVHLLWRPSAIPHTALPGFEGDDYLLDEQWARIADSIVERRPKVVSVIDYQWQKMVAARPELRRLYRPHGPVRMPRAMRPEPTVAPDALQRAIRFHPRRQPSGVRARQPESQLPVERRGSGTSSTAGASDESVDAGTGATATTGAEARGGTGEGSREARSAP